MHAHRGEGGGAASNNRSGSKLESCVRPPRERHKFPSSVSRGSSDGCHTVSDEGRAGAHVRSVAARLQRCTVIIPEHALDQIARLWAQGACHPRRPHSAAASLVASSHHQPTRRKSCSQLASSPAVPSSSRARKLRVTRISASPSPSSTARRVDSHPSGVPLSAPATNATKADERRRRKRERTGASLCQWAAREQRGARNRPPERATRTRRSKARASRD